MKTTERKEEGYKKNTEKKKRKQTTATINHGGGQTNKNNDLTNLSQQPRGDLSPWPQPTYIHCISVFCQMLPIESNKHLTGK